MSSKAQVPKSDIGPSMSSAVCLGIDVSHYSGEIDWKAKAHSGIKFMFAKCTEGQNIIDKTFYINWNKANESGVFTGAYHFFHPGQDVMSQYHNFMFTMGHLRKGDLPPVLDWEISNNMAAEFQKAQALRWLDAVEKESGMVPIIYSSPGFLRELGDLSAFKRYPLWVAEYGVSEPKLQGLPWEKWTFWQYAEKPGDMDYFNGTADELANHAVR